MDGGREKGVLKIKMYGLQVSGKAPKYITSDDKFILKCYNETENRFFLYFESLSYNDPELTLARFLPKYNGVQTIDEETEVENIEFLNDRRSSWLEHLRSRHDVRNVGDKYILLQNFTKGFKKANILDFKIGGRMEKHFKQTQSVKKYGFKLNGMHKSSSNHEEDFRSKYELNLKSSSSELRAIIAWFFYNREKKCLDLPIIDQAISALKEIVISFRTLRQWDFVSSSICIVYDFEREETFSLKLIDFGRAFHRQRFENCQDYDKNSSKGIECFLNFLLQIRKSPQIYDNMHLEKDKSEVVPSEKVQKYKRTPKKTQEQGKNNVNFMYEK